MNDNTKRELDFKTPPEVKDVEAYKNYKKWLNHPILTTKKMYNASDGKQYNLGLIKPRLASLIQHLPDEEKDLIMKQKDLFSVVHCRSNAYKLKAFRSGDKSAKGYHRILDSKSAELIELFGRMFKVKDVHRIVVEDWKLDISVDTITDFKKKNEVLINERIEAFKRDYSDIRLGIKKSRIEELVWLYGNRKALYNASQRKDDYELMLKTLEQLRKEVEGNSMTLNGKFEIDQELRIKQHVVQEVMKSLNVKQIVLGRIAAKMGTNPLLLQKTILESYYGKYFSKEQPMLEQPPTPTIETYDFQRIQKLVVQNKDADKRFVEAQVVESKVNEESAEVIKKQLINKLLNMNANVSNVKNQINKETR